MKNFSGEMLFLDRSDINTDEIIPARYLTEISKEALKPHLLEDLNMEEFDPQADIAGKRVIITRSNFGCGSSREHAPWALEVNGIHMVIAPSFARIFRQNMFNCGMMAVELPAETVDQLFNRFAGREAYVEVDFGNGRMKIKCGDEEEVVPFVVSDFDRNLVEAGGWVDFADTHY